MIRYGKVDSSGQWYIKIQRNLLEDMLDVRSMETSMLGM
jgi:hypothetical protein